MTLRLDDIHVSFGNVRAVAGVSLTLGAGDRMGIIGPNGSGKSTLINAISGIVRATGAIAVDGHRLRSGSARTAARRGVGRTYQTPQTFTKLTLIENVMLGVPTAERRGGTGSAWWRPRERRRTAEALDVLVTVGLDDLAEQPAAILTYGQQQRLALARALATRPRVLLLDEPAAGLNSAETQALGETLRAVNAGGVALLLVEHKMDFVSALCPRVAVLAGGRLVADGPPGDVLSRPDVIDAYLGVPHA
ncbi:ABC transporter ATP-binding protein [Dactylosporangium sp. CS-033363]|uniref:ABC transporter ATP-binding protein n=1 Tax=Dactylosporangium sp. CS-033363 TaxID=3239935 RepID=UPI003D8FD712